MNKPGSPMPRRRFFGAILSLAVPAAAAVSAPRRSVLAQGPVHVEWRQRTRLHMLSAEQQPLVARRIGSALVDEIDRSDDMVARFEAWSKSRRFVLRDADPSERSPA